MNRCVTAPALVTPSAVVTVGRTGFITSDVARVFRLAGVARRLFAGLKTCATSGKRAKLGYETGCPFLTVLTALTVFTGGCMPAPATSNTPDAGSPVPSSIVDPYLKIQAALFNDRVDEVRANAGNIATAATALGSPAFKIDTAAAQLASAGDLSDAREKFARLSDALITYMDGLHLTPPEGVHIAQCETTRKQWLQEGDSIANPYDGSSVPGCGTLR